MSEQGIHAKKIPEDLQKLIDKGDWYEISCYKYLTEDFIRENKDKVHWDLISQYQNLSESFIREFQDKCISHNQKLSESFIREFHDKVNWSWISCNQKLSESFIREFQDKINWPWISAYQKLSESFIREFSDRISWFYLKQNKHLPEGLAEKLEQEYRSGKMKKELDDSGKKKLSEATIEFADGYKTKLIEFEDDYESSGERYSTTGGFAIKLESLVESHGIHKPFVIGMFDEWAVFSNCEVTEFETIDKANERLAELNKKYAVEKKEGNQMSLKEDFIGTLSSDAKSAGVRILGKKSAEGVRVLLVKLLSAGISEEKMVVVDSFFKTEYGLALIQIILGSTIPFVPTFGEDKRVTMICDEYRVAAMAGAGGALIDDLSAVLGPITKELLASIPEEEDYVQESHTASRSRNK